MDATATATDLMTAFAERTGVTGVRSQRRYLWTDAFAVCNYLGLKRTDLALSLIDRVHHVLGQHRADDARRGWISGLADADGEAHPTLGGLRIGKPLPERGPDELCDARLEWERDGQYFHYLTRWMQALDQAARSTGDLRLATWARELADTAHRRFFHSIHGYNGMYWKMSIDLTRPQVSSLGHHDPLDGYVTYLQLLATRAPGPDLTGAVADFRAMLVPHALATADPLGLGALWFAAHRLAQLDRDPALRDVVVAEARRGLARYVEQRHLSRDADVRLAFRELGLAIGLAPAEHPQLRRLHDTIVGFWSEPAHRDSPTYREHQDINDVMLATSLAPDGLLRLA